MLVLSDISLFLKQALSTFFEKGYKKKSLNKGCYELIHKNIIPVVVIRTVNVR